MKKETEEVKEIMNEYFDLSGNITTFRHNFEYKGAKVGVSLKLGISEEEIKKS